MDNKNKSRVIESQFETSKFNYVSNLVSDASRKVIPMTPAETQECREIFDFLYEKLSESSKEKVARSNLSIYDPDIQYTQVEARIVALKDLNRGFGGSSSYKEKMPLLDYIYEEKNLKLFSYLRKKYKLSINNSYTQERTFKVKDKSTGIETEKTERYKTNIVDLAFNKCFLSHSKNIEEAIAPLTPKDLKEVGLSDYTKLRLQSLKLPNSGTRGFSNLSIYGEVERFVAMTGHELISEVGEGMCKIYIREIIASQFDSTSKKNPQTLIENLKKVEEKYKNVFTPETSLRLERYALSHYREKIVGGIATQMRSANERLKGILSYSPTTTEKATYVLEKENGLDIIITEMEKNKEKAWSSFEENFNYRQHDKLGFFKGLSVMIEEKRNSSMSYQRRMASPSSFGLDTAGHFNENDLQKIAFSLETIASTKAAPRQLHKI